MIFFKIRKQILNKNQNEFPLNILYQKYLYLIQTKIPKKYITILQNKYSGELEHIPFSLHNLCMNIPPGV